MNVFIIPVLAAVAQAGELLEAKFLLTRRQISLRDFNPITFLFLAGFSALLMPWLGEINVEAALSLAGIAMITGIIILAASWNMLYYASIKHQKVNASESIIILMPITTIVLAWVFAPGQFDGNIAAAAVIATGAIAWGFWHRHQLSLGSDGFKLLAAVLLMSLENLLVARVLQQHILSPVSLYTLRCSVIFVIFFIYYRPAIKRLKPVTLHKLTIGSAIGASSMLLWFYGLRDAGPIITALVLILSPLLVFAASAKLLHERLGTKQLIAAIISIVSVAYAVIVAGQAAF